MIDTHAHPLLCSRPLPEWFANAKAAGLTQIVGVATTIQMGLDTLALSRHYPILVPTIGIHPCEAKTAERLDELASLVAANPEFKAIGEIGLDFYRDNGPLALQASVFEAQMDVARQFNLPVILHSRNADQEIMTILPKYTDVKKVFHCFSSDLDFVRKAANETTIFSFTGMVTYSNKAFLNEVIAYLPLSSMMIETDCPYLTPTVYGKQENQPSFVGEVAKRIAEVKGLPLDTVISETTKTAVSFFDL